MAGANDAQSAVTLAAYSANIIAIVGKLRTAGITPIMCTVTPNNNTTYDANVRLYNAWLRNWCPANGVILVDTHAAVAKSSGGWVTGMADGDGLHPSATGQKAMAQALITALTPMVSPSGSPVAYSSGAPNLLGNSAFLTDANADGIPDGWWSSGLTPTYIADSGTYGFKWARITGSGATLGSFNSPEITTGYTAGTDTLRFTARVRSGQDGATAKAGLKVDVTCFDNSYGVKGNFAACSLNGGLSQKITDGVCAVDFTVPAGTTKIMATLSNGTFDMAAGVTGTYDIALPTLLNLTTLGLA